MKEYVTINNNLVYHIFFMEERKNILRLLYQSQLFTQEVKQEVIDYFDRLNDSQVNWLYQALTAEKLVLLNFLKWLKDSWELEYDKILSMKNNVLRRQRKEMEQRDNIETKDSIENILITLDNI